MLNFVAIQQPSHANTLKFIDFLRSHAPVACNTNFKPVNNFFDFPWTLQATSTSSLDFFRVIELFVKTTATSALNNSNRETVGTKCHLNRSMIKYMHHIEHRLLEEMVWRGQSSIWSELARIKLNPNYTDKLAYSYAIPLNEELYHQLSTNNSMKSVTNSYNNSSSGILGAAVLSTNGSDMLSLSPAKFPTITRVVCSTNQTNNSIQVCVFIKQYK